MFDNLHEELSRSRITVEFYYFNISAINCYPVTRYSFTYFPISDHKLLFLAYLPDI